MIEYKGYMLDGIRLVKEKDCVIAYLDVLKLVCPAKTSEDALKNLTSTVTTLLNAFESRGILKERMMELGIKENGNK